MTPQCCTARKNTQVAKNKNKNKRKGKGRKLNKPETKSLHSLGLDTVNHLCYTQVFKTGLEICRKRGSLVENIALTWTKMLKQPSNQSSDRVTCVWWFFRETFSLWSVLNKLPSTYCIHNAFFYAQQGAHGGFPTTIYLYGYILYIIVCITYNMRSYTIHKLASDIFTKALTQATKRVTVSVYNHWFHNCKNAKKQIQLNEKNITEHEITALLNFIPQLQQTKSIKVTNISTLVRAWNIVGKKKKKKNSFAHHSETVGLKKKDSPVKAASEVCSSLMKQLCLIWWKVKKFKGEFVPGSALCG